MIEKGRIILLNGTSSSGKTTLARALHAAVDPRFHYYASDQLADAGFRPMDVDVRFAWREAFFDGFHRSIPSFASAGLDIIVEHIVERASWAEQLATLLTGFDVFWVGVHAPVPELLRRGKARGDRHAGEALEHLGTHGFCRYDIEVDTTEPAAANVAAIQEAWRLRVRAQQRLVEQT